MAKSKTKALQVIETEPIALMTPESLKNQMAVETKKRELITQYINQHMKDGIDYGKIHIAKNCQYKGSPKDCKNQNHFSKNALFKPGAEKFSSLFNMRAEFLKDTETWEMLGSVAGTIAYTCKLYTSKGVLVGEGKGVATVAEKGHPNTAVKIAKKRAFVDAVLTTGALSDFFTQDEDIIAGTAVDMQDDVKTVQYEDVTNKPVRPDLFETAKKMIREKTSVTDLLKGANGIRESKKYTDEQRKELLALIKERVELIDKEAEEKSA